jgi:Flp pilus assembly protein TadG
MSDRSPNRHQGIAMVEFAIVLPLLLMVLFGVTEIGRAMV